MRRLFWNAAEGRLRGPWRLAIFIGLVGLLANPPVLLLDATGIALLERSLVNPIVALAFLAALAICARWVDRRPLSDFGLSSSRIWWVEIGVGLAAGAAGPSVALGLAYLAGWVRLEEIAWTSLAAPFAAVLLGQVARYLGGAFFEELFSRGYLLRLVAESMRARLGGRRAVVGAWLLTAAIFGVLHAWNPGVTVLSAWNLTVIGAAYGVGMILTGRLAIPIGFHAGWNLFQNCVFGLPNSGQSPVATLMVTRLDGPEIWTGGAFGIEGGLLGLLACAVGVAVVLAWLRLRPGGLTLATSLAEPPVGQSRSSSSTSMAR
jgi:membrane protease YdiL (CAAX protease family)